MERIRNEGLDARNAMIKFYNIEENKRGSFFLQVEWLLENAVYPYESGYADNLMDLWNVYMPSYEFNRIVLEYSKICFPVLRYVHDNEIFKFNSVKLMQECTIKNYVKYCISQGQTNRVRLVKECFDLLKDISDRTKLYDLINNNIEYYFVNGEIEQYSVMFLKRFQDYAEQPYIKVVERLKDIHEQKEQALCARPSLLKALNVPDYKEEQVQTLINIMLCRLAMADGESKFSEVLEETWRKTISEFGYTDIVYTFIEKYEKTYMNAACYGIKNIKDRKIIMQLYKDAVILCAALQSIEKGEKFGIREIKDFLKQDGMYFTKRYFFNDEYERMKQGFDEKTLLLYKDEIWAFHDALIKKINSTDFSVINSNNYHRDIKNAASEMNHAALNEKDRQIEELQERISEFEEKLENIEKEVLLQFISLLDSKKYDYVLGKLYRIAYANDGVKIEDIQRILKNLFEIMNISGIDIYGELGTKVNEDDIRRGKYRVDAEISNVAQVKYPGYRIASSVILHPFVEEV